MVRKERGVYKRTGKKTERRKQKIKREGGMKLRIFFYGEMRHASGRREEYIEG